MEILVLLSLVLLPSHAMAQSRIVQLARTILDNAEKLDGRLKARSLPELSLGLDSRDDSYGPGIPPDDAEAQLAKELVLSASGELNDLLRGPSGSLHNLAGREYDLAVLKIIHRFNIARSFEVGQSATFDSIAERCGLDVSHVRRILRYAMTSNIFAEPSPDVVVHTAFSRSLAQSTHMQSEVGQAVDEQFGAAAFMAEALAQFGSTDKPNETAWNLANNAEKPMFAELQQNHPDRAYQFGAFMDLWAVQHPTEPLISDSVWSVLPNGSHVVDIGGGHGHVSAALAQAFPSFRFTVQDLAETVAQGPNKIPAGLQDRIFFTEHDFMAPQPAKGADVYFFRSIFHDWPDESCVKILRNLVPALKLGARIVLNELCLSSGKLAPPIERIVRNLDLVMMSLFNGRERSEDDFARLFREADPRFKFIGAREPVLNEVGVPVKGLMSVVEASWNP